MNQNEYRSVPHRAGAANDPAAVKKFDLKNDNVSVVNSGESDPMPNQEAMEAYDETSENEAADTEIEAGDENDFENQQGLAEGKKTPRDSAQVA